MIKRLASLILAIAGFAMTVSLKATTNTPPDFDLGFYAGTAAQEGNGIAVDSNGNIYVTGQYAGAANIGGASLPAYGSQDFYLASFDTNGSPRWGVGAGTSSSDYGTTVKIASNGDLVVAMNMFTPLSLHGTNITGFGGRDAMVARYTSSGALLWAKVVGGSSNDSADDLAFDADGNIILVGRIDGTATAGTNTLGASFQNRHFMVKYNATGDVVWAKTVSNNGTSGTGVAVDSNNDIVFTGTGYVGSTNSIFVAKFDSSGTQLWQTNHTSAGGGSAIALDSANNIYVAGTFNSSSITFGSTTLTNSNNALRGFLAKYDSNGNPLWANRIGGRAYRLVVQPDGTAFTCGFFLNTTTNFNDDTITLKGSGTRNGFITRHDSDGQLNWIRRVGAASSGEILRSITRDATGTIHVIGEGTTEAMDIDVTPQTGSVIIGRLSTNSFARFTLTTSISPEFGGVLGISPEHSDNIYLSNAVVQLTAYPGSGKAFAGWSNDASGMSNPLNLVMDGNKNVTAVFTNVPVPSFTLGLYPGAGGSITADPPSATGVYESNTIVTLTAIPASSNIVFLNWIGATPFTNNPVTITMNYTRNVFAVFSNAATGTYEFTEIAWTNTVNPGNSSLFTKFAAPVIDGSNVVFESGSAPGYQGLFSWQGSNITKAVDTTEIAPNTAGNYSWLVDFDYKFVEDGVLYFGATNTTGVWGIYALSNGVVSRVVDSTFTVPGATNLFRRVRAGVKHNGESGFVGYRRVGTNTLDSSGIYTMKNGVLTKVIDQDSGNLPGASLPYLSGDSIALENGGMAFYASQGVSSFTTAGIYFKDTNGFFNLIADTNTIVPGNNSGKFTSFIDSVFQENGKVIFWASFSGGSGFYSANTDGTGLMYLVDTAHTLVPGTVGSTFGFFNGGSYKNGRLLFNAYRGNINGLYIWENGNVTKVISNLDVLKYGFPINFFIISAQAIQDDGYITFNVRFQNGSTAVYTTLPGTLPRYSLNFTSNPGNVGDLYRYPNVMPSNSIPAGTLVTVMGIPLLSNYKFTNFTGSFGVVSTNPFQFVMNSNVTIVANFVDTNTPLISQFTLITNVSPSGGGSIQLFPDSADGTYDSNTIVQLTAVPPSGKAFAGWSGSVTSSANPLNVTMSTNTSITATFTNIPVGPTVTLTTNVSPAGFGSISVDPPGTTFTSNTVVTLTANPAAGKIFVRWTGASTAKTNPISLTMNGNKSITAVFTNAPAYYALSTNITPADSGTITASPAPTTNGYAAKTIVTLTATPKTGFKFVKWSGASAALTKTTAVTMNTNKTITAVFTNIPKFNLNVVLSPTNAGTVIKSPAAISSNDFYSGTIVSLTPVPKTGFKFVKWTGALTGAIVPGKVAMSASKTVTAVFAPVPTFQLTATVNPPGAGDVLANPAPATNGYSSNAVVGLTATVNGTNQFVAWTGALSSFSNQVNITMNSNKSVTAVYNAPGKLYWQSTNSFVALWLMQESNFVASAVMNNGKGIAKSWRLAGTVDFDNNGSKDLLFQNNSGAVMLWMMTNNFIVRTQVLKTAPLGIKLIGAGNFTTNTSPDLLWQNNKTGALMLWTFKGVTYSGSQNVTSAIAPGTTWKALGVADFDNDGQADIVFQNTDGRVMLWFMNGATMTSSVILNGGVAATTNWKVAAISDLDSNGTPDILFQIGGQSGVWELNGTNIISQSFIANGGTMPASWSLRAGK